MAIHLLRVNNLRKQLQIYSLSLEKQKNLLNMLERFNLENSKKVRRENSKSWKNIRQRFALAQHFSISQTSTLVQL